MQVTSLTTTLITYLARDDHAFLKRTIATWASLPATSRRLVPQIRARRVHRRVELVVAYVKHTAHLVGAGWERRGPLLTLRRRSGRGFKIQGFEEARSTTVSSRAGLDKEMAKRFAGAAEFSVLESNTAEIRNMQGRLNAALEAAASG